MAKIDSKSVEEYQKILAADPNSKVFAVLGEAYRELGILEQAENILRRGITKHPTYAAGYIVLAKIFLQKKNFEGSLKLLQEAVSLSPDNLLAYQLIGETQLQLKNPKEALKAHKMALFLSPNNPRSQQVVKSLEKLTADEFEEDLFSLRSPHQKLAEEPKPVPKESPRQSRATDSEMERALSFIDALILRQQGERAQERLLELQSRFPGNREIESRLTMIEADEQIEKAEPILPLKHREQRVINQKIQRLHKVLRALGV